MCRQLTALALSALLTSCVTSSLVRPDFQLPLAQEVAFVSPVTTVAISRNFSPAVADKAATLESARLLRLALLQHRAELRLRNEVTIPDSLLLRARQEIYQAVVGIEERWQLGNRANLPVLDYLLAQQSQCYALLTVASGLTFIPKRSRPYLSGQPRLGGSLSGSVSSTTAGQPTSNIFLLLYDQQRHAFVYYRHTPPLATHEPLDALSMEHDFAKLLKKDFRLVKQLQ